MVGPTIGGMSTPDWFADAVLYEVYPQSFADSNGDGIGDLRGVIDHLDHIASLGVDAIWFNPCFASPFVDAGYDVSDYLTVAPRYGSNADMVELVAAAKQRGIRVLLDLVAGHTSIDHEWFQRELHRDGPDPEGDRYIWCDEPPTSGWTDDLPGTPAWVPSPGPRPGWYLKNFYDEQPALNFGWSAPDAGQPWRAAPDDPGPRRNRRALREIIDFWLDLGVAGFRIDMAFSLVKDDVDRARGLKATTDIWREIRDWLDEAHPDAVIVPEGIEPRTEGRLSFHADFFLVIHPQHASLFDNHYAGEVPFHDLRQPFFDASGGGTTQVFLDGWHRAKRIAPDRLVMMSTADHDFTRLRCGPRGPEQLGAALTFLLTWGTVPCIYFGDEIGMRYLEACRTWRARSASPRTTAPAAARRCSGTTATTPGSPPPTRLRCTCPSIRHPTVRRSPRRRSTLIRRCTWCAGSPRSGGPRRRCAPGRARGWYTTATPSPTCAAAPTSWSSIPGASRPPSLPPNWWTQRRYWLRACRSPATP